ncbi:MAG TPA: nucleoside recognition protein [Prolixibacteraceae bacterium]|nr:nucleoside recognition protein [Prolixibacteraceae bacterium]
MKRIFHFFRQSRLILKRVIRQSLPQGMKTAIWLLKLTIPIAFGVFLLDYLRILDWIAQLTEPLFNLIGLSGNASVILITSFFTNIYSVIAVMATLDMPVREGIILANMCLIAHALIVESGIQKKTGSSAIRMVSLRIFASFLAAWILNQILPGIEGTIKAGATLSREGLIPDFFNWLKSITITSIKIVVLVNLLLIFQKLLQELGILKWLVSPFHPLLTIMGLPRNTGFLWLVAYTLGLSYGGAVMIGQSSEGHLSRSEADLLNHHIAISHSQLEDTLLFAAVGFSIPWLIFPRFVIAVATVWLRRLELRLRIRVITA